MLTKTILLKGAAMAVTGLAGTVLVSKVVPKYVKKDLEKNKTKENPDTSEKQMTVMTAGEVAALGAVNVIDKLI